MQAATAPSGAGARETAAGVGLRAARGGSVLLLRHVIGFAVNAAGGIVLARALGPAVMGLYFAAYTLFAIGRQLVDFSVTPHLIRHPEADSQLGPALWLQRSLAAGLGLTVSAAVASGLVGRLAPGHGTPLSWLLMGAALGAACFAWQSVPVAGLERRLAYRRIGWIEVLEPLTFNGVAIALVLAGGGGARALAVALFLRGALPAIAAQCFGRLPSGVRMQRAGSAPLARLLLPLVGAQATLWAILVAPVVLVGKLAGPEALGQAQLAYSLLGSIGIPAVVFQRVTFAALSRLQADAERFAHAARRALVLLAAFYLPLLSLSGSLAPLWVPRVCGPQWTPMAGVLAAATLPVALASAFGILYVAVLAEGRNRIVWWQNVVHGVIYWAVLAAAARPLGPLSVPLAHLAALPAGILYYRAFRARHGDLPLGGVAAAIGLVSVLTLGCWKLAAGGHAVVAASVWCLAAVLILPWVWRRLGLGALGRAILRGESLEVSRL